MTKFGIVVLCIFARLFGIIVGAANNMARPKVRKIL